MNDDSKLQVCEVLQEVRSSLIQVP